MASRIAASTVCAMALLIAFRPQAGSDPASVRPWTEYRTIMWVGDSAWKSPEKSGLFFQRLKEMGVNTGMVGGDGPNAAYQEHQFPFYVENLVNRGLCLKWNSKVKDWDAFITQWSKEGRSPSALVRDYCLDDPKWMEWARSEVRQVVGKNHRLSPLAYDLRDELSTTISANPFDYDFNPLTLAAFRNWLKQDYSTLDKLNQQWETRFISWEEVVPFTTDQIKARMSTGQAVPTAKPDWQALANLKFDFAQASRQPTRWNFSPWADFRSYMDLSLARTLQDLRQAARAIDPVTPVGIEGTQMPHAFGGYDLWRLSQAVDWVEPYDIGNAREIFGSFMPRKPIMATVFEKDANPARRRLWHLLLEGDKGCIVWWSEDCIDWKSSDLQLTPKAKALAPVLKEMTSDLARLFLNAERVADPVFIHYSQPSIQVDWLLESTVDGPTWLRRFSSFEADHNRLLRVRNAWLKLFQDLGFTPRFVSSQQIEQGALRGVAPSVMVLPGSLAISDLEAREIEHFQKSPQNVVLYDGTSGCFDSHGKLRSRLAVPALVGTNLTAACSGLGARPRFREGDVALYAVRRMKAEPETGWPEWVEAQVTHLPGEVKVAASARVRTHRFRVPQGRLLAFERNINYHMSEDLKQAGGNEAMEQPIEVEAKLKQPFHVYDLRRQAYVGRTDQIRFSLSPWEPSLFALLDIQISPDKLLPTLMSGPER